MSVFPIILAVSLIIAVAAPARARDKELPEPGTRYRVSSVEQGDTLTVRVQPGIEAPVVGALGASAQEIIVTGVRQKIDASTWWEIVFPSAERKSGWVNARFLSAQNAEQSRKDTNYSFECTGTEPFWSITIDDRTAWYSSPDQKDETFSVTSRVTARGLQGHFVFQIKDPSATADLKGAVVVNKAYDFCSDNMSDNKYPFYATAILPNGEVLGGCCSRSAK